MNQLFNKERDVQATSLFNHLQGISPLSSILKMRKLRILPVLLLLILSCNNKKESTSKDRSGFEELSKNENFEKVSDTSYSKTQIEQTHRITHIRNNAGNLILFKRLVFDENGNENQSILDTLLIQNLDSIFYITIGYCEMENTIPEEIIAIVERTEKDTIQTIAKAWKANSQTRKIESIKNVNSLTCLNEF